MSVNEVGEKLVAMCRENKNLDAIAELYADDVVSVEAMEPPGPQFDRVTTGRDAVRKKNEWWISAHDVHGGEISGPFPHGDRFAVVFKHEVTSKEGPMAGQRMSMEEVALYTVADGKITREEFFYSMG